ncbi:hypothetical protein A2608_03440 [Candidatus Azambacteria bacterium RIFOXYD1_FULL_44_10]|nr:MAG: hypothetical protein A2608_03440 [Candidatus Azambacteria bacterium RIFOXYD1_FULL_44_10]
MKRYFIFLAAVALFTAVIWGLIFVKTQGVLLEVIFFDVGQGDSILIKTPYEQTMLVDGGPDNRVLNKLGDHLPPLQKRIDIVILTHPHADHVTGLVEVLKRYDVGVVIMSAAYLKTDIYGEFLKTLRDKNTSIIFAKAGQALHFGPKMDVDILWPERNKLDLFGGYNESFGMAGNDVNDDSVVTKMSFGDFALLMTGDATSAVEKQLLAYGNGLRADILKVGHHGSKYSSSLEVLKLVQPQASIIEVGARNRYGHPAPATLDRLKNFSPQGADQLLKSETFGVERPQAENISIFRTDKDSDIKVLSNGYTTSIFKEK